MCTFNDLVARNRAGKAIISLPDNAKVLTPILLEGEDDVLMAITTAGRMLMFPVADLPQLSKGKGNKIIAISAADFAAGKDRLAWLQVLSPQASVTLFFGKRKLVLRQNELQKYHAERGRKGTLYAACSALIRIEVEAPPSARQDNSEE